MKNNQNSPWRAPRKITQQISARKISWLELFSDLVYVVIIHSLTVGLGTHLSLSGLLTFLVLFYLVFNSWNNLAIYFDLHGDDSIRTVLLTMVQIALVALLAGSISPAFQGEFFDTAIVYLAIQLLFMYMWWTTARFDPEHMLTTRPYLQAYLIGASLLVAMLFTPAQWQLYLLIGVVLIDFLALFFESNNFNREFKQRHIPFKISDSLLERYGQFTMIVLGESLANLVELFEDGLTVKSTFTFLLLVVSTMALWWLYYSLMDDIEVNAPNYQRLVLFRRLHINFILFLTLECFFLIELGHHGTDLLRYGYLLSLGLTLITLTAMVIRHQNNHINRRSLLTTGVIFGICLGLCAFLPRYPMLIVIDMLLITACVYRERNIIRNQMTKQ